MGRQLLVMLALLSACTREADNSSAAPTGDDRPSGNRIDAAGPKLASDAVDPASPLAAVQVVQRYLDHLAAGRYAEAHRLWWDEGSASGSDVDAFAARFAGIAELRGQVGAPGRIEGAAGSAYVDVPVQVQFLLRGDRSGRRGTLTLRRANDVPGSAAEQRQWRIYRSELDFPPADGPSGRQYIGRWATEAALCPTTAWRITETSLVTPAGSVCRFSRVTEVPGGYDVAARCTAEGPPIDDVLKLRFAQSAGALLFESRVIADAGLVRCPGE